MTCDSISFNDHEHILHMRKTWLTLTPDGQTTERRYLCSKHPVTGDEVRGLLEVTGFEIEQSFGGRDGRKLTRESDRAIFWARKPSSG